MLAAPRVVVLPGLFQFLVRRVFLPHWGQGQCGKLGLACVAGAGPGAKFEQGDCVRVLDRVFPAVAEHLADVHRADCAHCLDAPVVDGRVGRVTTACADAHGADLVLIDV
ncbi:hypothetical protein D3C81_2027440 [compost metagenome]